jgi:hypothetical protein
MHRLSAALAGFLFAVLPASAETSRPKLEVVGEFPGRQITGVAVSRGGRLFVNLPYWSEPHTVSVAEVKDGKLIPYPDEVWNQNLGDPGTRFVCVQSIYVDDKDRLWVVDPAAFNPDDGFLYYQPRDSVTFFHPTEKPSFIRCLQLF